VGTPVDELYGIVRETLAGRASEVLLGRMRVTLEEGAGSPQTLQETCTRLEKMARLFLGSAEASSLKERFARWRAESSSSGD